jgi:CheY-like chemotaxis protein
MRRAGPAGTVFGLGLSCVIVDDNGPFRQSARILLEREGVSVAATAATAAEALDRVRAHEPDVVLVDVALGEENGIDLARKLTADGRPVILISANADNAALAPSSHAVGFLTKTELSAGHVRELLRIVPDPGAAG